MRGRAMTSFRSYGSTGWLEAGRRASGPWAARRLRGFVLSAGKLAALVAGTGLVLGLAAGIVSSRQASEAPAEPVQSWIEVNRPIQLYGLAGTEFSKLPLNYRARRHAVGGGRQDILTFGDLQGDEPFLALSLYRRGGETMGERSFRADLERLAGQEGLGLSRLGAPAVLVTRFGAFEAGDLRLLAQRISTPCLGFRTSEADPVLLVSGFVCGARERPIGRDALGCVIDRIDLDSAGEDTALRNVFVQAERRRGADCTPSPLTAAGAKTTWLAANSSLPPLKGVLTTSAKHQ